ncbi:F-box only protein 21-like [Camponotus floridanus]|uniref:F-box only protein 21-like n=1 Tax=Camponotus floridanus TaxID=104421 RepID=UPI000DC676BA|nr:F-box only protein 21-like [Camponotus floridanus]
MASIMCLPEELIARILSYNDISIEDIINFRCTCKQFEWAAKYGKYWEKKFSQRWPFAKKFCDKIFKENEQKESEKNEQKNKKSLNFMETGIKCARQLRNYVSQFIHDHFYIHFDFSIDNFINLETVFCFDKDLNKIICKPDNFINIFFFMDEIKSLLAQSPRRAGCDLTERYCNIKLFYYLRYHLIREYWERFEEQPHKKLLLELGATIIVQRFQPQKDVFYSIIKTSLDNIALEVLNYLREEHPDHSIFSTTAENFAYWKNNNIDDNHWDEMEGTQIMNALEEYIFDKLNFKLNKSKNIDYMCIDNVLERKCGEEIILFIIYQSVARRLGLRCDIIKLPHCSRVCIFWKPKYVTSSLEDVRCFNLSYATFPDCLVEQRCSEKPLAITAEEIRQNLIEILICMNVEWCKNTLAPMPPKAIRDVWDINLRELNFHVYIKKQSNIRPKEIKFAVGMIVAHNHKRFDHSLSSSAGVIVGWHRYEDHVMFPRYNLRKPLNILCSNFNSKTHYIILGENNKTYYVEEDAITKTTPKWIDNNEIGLYFCKFEDTHYVPNEILATCYPHDAAITAAISDD